MKLGNGLFLILRRQGWYLVCAAIVIGGLAACSRQAGPTATLAATPRPALTAQVAPSVAPPPPPSQTPAPTATSEPLALTVNGQDITLAKYNRELARCQAGKTGAGADPADCPAAVLSQLTKQAVIEQAAAAAGITVAQSDVDAALNKITASLGGPGALAGWDKLVRTYGKRTLAAALTPAIGYARDGFPVTPIIASQWAAETALLQEDSGAATTFLPNGRAPKAGEAGNISRSINFSVRLKP